MTTDNHITTITYPAAPTAATATVAVHTRDKWADPWVARPELQCTSCTFTAQPSTSSAVFRHRYGVRAEWGSLGTALRPKLSINPRSYVRVTITPTPGMPGSSPVYWYGIWKHATDRGLVQQIPAVGLDGLLNFTRVTNAKYVDMFGTIRDAGRGLTFNAGGKPNRTKAKRPVNASNAYLFEENPEQAVFWSTRDIVEYLIEANPPTDKDGNIILTFSLLNKDVLPNFDQPEIPSHDRDVLTVLRSLITRQRLIGFTVSAVDLAASGGLPAVAAAYVNCFTFTEKTITLKDDDGNTVGLIPENLSVFAYDIQRDTTAKASLSIDAQHVADKVTVLGGNRVSVCSLSYDDISLKEGWEFDEQADHKLAARLAPDYPVDAEVREQEQRNKEARSSDRLKHVFATFKVFEWWEQEAFDGFGDGTAYPIALEDDGTTQFRIMQSNLFPLRELPLLRGYDYEKDIIKDNETLKTSGHRGRKVGKAPFYPLPMLVAIRVPTYKDGERDDYDPNDPEKYPRKYVYIDQVGKVADLEIEDYDDGVLGTYKPPIARQWSGRVRVLRDVPGFEIDVVGAEQHILGKVEYAGHPDEMKGMWSWKDMIATVAFEELRRAQIEWPETPASVGEFLNEIVIDVGRNYQLVYVTPNTVVGIDETTGDLIRSTGGYLQDDRPLLRTIAQRAYEWYKVPRYALNFSTSFIDGRLAIGQYVKSIRRLGVVEPVGSVITQLTFAFPVVNSETPPQPKVFLRTAFGELDAARVV
jgi:hypothetical protein